jgi:hypothetical protein
MPYTSIVARVCLCICNKSSNNKTSSLPSRALPLPPPPHPQPPPPTPLPHQDERIEKLAKTANSWIYAVSVTGVTGARADLASDLPAFLARIRKHTDGE